MKLVRYALEKRAVILVLIVFLFIGGYLSYERLGRLEDPDFTIKETVIYTLYPGATAEEVELEITEPLETAIQQLKQLEEVRSISRSGVSIIYAEVQDKYDKETLPQVWDELRRKIGDAASALPPGSYSPIINDDFGDVYGIFFAITGDGYSQHALQEIAEDLRKELLLCEDVGRIDFWGMQEEVVYVEIDRVKSAQLGIPPAAIFQTISQQNTVSDAGKVKVGPHDVRLRVSGDYANVLDIGEQLIRSGDSGTMIRIKDVATIEKGYLDPSQQLLRRDGLPAVGLGISTVSGGNVVTMGNAVKDKLIELEGRLPVGVTLNTIAYQADTVNTAVNGFVLNLFEAVLIVVVLLVIFMGVREGFIIGGVLLLTILATFICMFIFEVNLQRISLGALIIALGMLVDNAIVVAEGIVIKHQLGVDKKEAAIQTVAETQWPLLGATIIAILAFAAISLSKDVTGEFLGSLFQVIGLSLMLSWILAITVVPYLCVTFLLDQPKNNGALYDNVFFRGYRAFLQACITFRWLTISAVIGMLALAIYGFGFVDHNFFPNSPRPQFTIDMTLPEGTHIEETAAQLRKLESYVSSLEGVSDVTTFVGGGALRFILTYSPEMPNSSYGQLLVSVSDYRLNAQLIPEVAEYINTHFPDAVSKVEAFKLGPSSEAVEARFIGSDIEVLRDLADQAKVIMWKHENTNTVQSDWAEKVKVASVNMAAARSREIGVTRPEIANALAANFAGTAAGLYREGEDLLPIIVRQPLQQRSGIDNLHEVMVWSDVAGQAVPIDQVANGSVTQWEDPVIQRRNRMRTITVSCQQVKGTADALFRELRSDIEAIDLPQGYVLEWGGEYESSGDANRKLMSKVPLAFAVMFFISVMLFNTLRHPVIIFLGLPLALIGVAAGLLIFKQPFGFMALLGFLSLSGMLMKNEIVLLDQINIELAAGKHPYQAVIDSAVSRVRPVSMAAFTTVLGMVPLLWDAFFAAMAVTIMGGLTFATVLTLVIVPVLYCTFFRVSEHMDVRTGSTKVEQHGDSCLVYKVN
ncbi:efflux RND transporter permease subunit [Desulfogranum marinum]|uniref:efflux RND transporter permease subunit n=1 Tax=Desulfogranum marinum TaxID=453220 RepID=UPI00196576D6|nr:efflux RND transporter permease subunit [Desulfogranum marinum]MBM9511461.1 efflux RND transporter permease subunit [Desulfogranum marinum]